MVLGQVERPPQRCLLDEEVIDEELAADVDGNDRGRRGQISRRDWLIRWLAVLRRPGGGEADAVVKPSFSGCFTGTRLAGEGNSHAGGTDADKLSTVHGSWTSQR